MKKKSKMLLFIIMVIILLDFVKPPQVMAESTKENSKLVKPISQLLCFASDAIMGTCQKMFVTTDSYKRTDKEIKADSNTQTNGTQSSTTQTKYYSVKYSPAIIFSGAVPAFDVNFINPGSGKKSGGQSDYAKALTEKTEIMFAGATKLSGLTQYNQEIHALEASSDYKSTSGSDSTSSGDKYSYYIFYKVDEDGNLETKTLFIKLSEDRNYEYYKYENTYSAGDDFLKEVEYTSTAKVLQSTIATFYNVLRKIALIGLLSVLVYIGIRIVLTSTSAKDKAKYKNMLKDWLVAMCILFTLHYIMSITITVVESLCDLFQASLVGANGEDVMLTTLRNRIANSKSWGNVIVDVILYTMVSVYTIIFTIQYLRRTIYIAFLTVISPLITLTYPLDKIKDNKSQAFDMWIKDYIFFMLLQVVHLLIYYTIVGSSLDMSSQGDWVIAIAAMTFLLPAEKIIKKMFGFGKSKTLDAVSAGVTGGLVLNALNKIGGKGGPGPKGGPAPSPDGANSHNVRTASNTSLNDALTSLKGGGNITPPEKKGSKAGGAGAVVKKYAKPTLGALAGAATGAAGGILGFAAGAVQGDLTTAIAGATAGTKAGKNIGHGAVNLGASIIDSPKTITNAVNNLTDVFNEGAYGAEYAGNVKAVRDFKESSAYSALKDKYGDEFTDDKLSVILQAGIKDKGDIDKILEGDNVSDAIGYYTLAKKCPDSIYYDDDKLEKYLEDLGVDETNAKIMRDNMRKFK